jgi:hypothetical protein
MKWIKKLSIGIVLIGAVDSCIKEPSYSDVPRIELKDVYFKKGSLNQLIADTLVIKLKFTDGDGDLGIGPEDAVLPDYQNPIYWAYNTTNFSLISGTDKSVPLPAGYTFLDYKARKLSQFASLPGINCQNWELLSDNGSPPLVDTIYITQNLRAFNFNVSFYTRVSVTPEKYELLDPSPFVSLSKCTANLFRGTFPDLSNDRKSAPLDGIITYRIQSLGLSKIFANSTLKMEVTINDRAFHDSKPVEKKGFTIQQITK